MKQCTTDEQEVNNVEHSVQALGNELNNLSEVVAYFNFYSVDRKSNVR